jgi:putative oxidoreductase
MAVRFGQAPARRGGCALKLRNLRTLAAYAKATGGTIMALDSINKLLARLRPMADRISFMGPTLARITVGVVFMGTGWGKLHALASVTDFFTSLHIPAPWFQARLVAGTEFFGGLLVLLGLATRLVSIPLAITMIVAIATAKRDDLSGLQALLGFEEWSYLVLFAWLALAGAGPLSLDALVKRVRGRQPARANLPNALLQP